MKRLLFFIFIFFTTSLYSQFYNGYQMYFGKNRIQYNNFNWWYYQNDNFDVYFYDRDITLGKYINEIAEKEMKDMEEFFGIVLNEKIIFIVYNHIRDFRQTNLGLESEGEGTLGGTTELIGNKAFLYYEGDHQKLELQLRKVIAKIYFRKLIYGTALTEKITNGALLEVPQWYEKGIIAYCAREWDTETENFVRDFVLTHKHVNFNNLEEKQAEYIGQSFWYFISIEYGKDVIPNLFYFAKVQKSVYKAFGFVLGKNFKKLQKDWYNYFSTNFCNDIQNTDNFNPEENLITKPSKNLTYQSLAVSPNRKYAVFATNNSGKYKVWLYDIQKGKKKKIYKQGHKLPQIIDYGYPVIAWNTKSSIFAFITEKGTSVKVNLYNVKKNELKQKTLLYIDKVLDMNFSADDRYLALSAVNRGYTDLFLFDLFGGSTVRLTYDLADDLNPSFLPGTNKIIFASNRKDTSSIFRRRFEENPMPDKQTDLFTIDIKTRKIERYTNTAFVNEKKPFGISHNKIIYLSDSTGIINLYKLNKDSAIAFVDTAIHYSYFTNTKQITNFNKNISDFKKSENQYSFKYLYKGRDYLNIPQKLPETNTKNFAVSSFWKKFIEDKKKNFIREKQKQKQTEQLQIALDTLKYKFDSLYNVDYAPYVDISNYIFEFEKDTLFKIYYFEKFKEQTDTSKNKQHFFAYVPIFYMKDVGNSLDLMQYNQSYQTFNGGPFYFNNGFNYLTKVQINELFEDYRIIGAFRFGIFNKSYEYLASVENLKKRLDKQYVFYRQSYTYVNDTFYIALKEITNQINFSLKYPFNQVAAIKWTLLGRTYRFIPLSTEYVTLVAEEEHKYFAGTKLEFIYDNALLLEQNIYSGLRFKIFGEVYQQIKGDEYRTFVAGFDFRFYKEIVRHTIFATRFAGSGSFGSGKIVYYLGGEDYWVQLLNPIFNYKININQQENYMFQAVATNLRGFRQNIRNGNKFILTNNEIRMPIVRMLFNRPVISNFWNSFQLAFFADAGTAWCGSSPWDKEANSYNTLVVTRGDITIRVDVDRPPIVWGYGWGMRMKILGYFVKFDWAWGVEGYYTHKSIFYLALSKDF